MKYIVLITFTFTATFVMGQKNTVLSSKIVNDTKPFFEAGQYREATKRYLEALELNDENINAQFQLAESYRYLQDYQSAEKYYGMIADKQSINKPEAGFRFAQMQKQGGKYEEALESFKSFKEFMVREGLHDDERWRTLYDQAKVEIDGCQMALDQNSMIFTDREFGALQVPINSEYRDYAAITVNNDSEIYLSSARSDGKQSLLEPQYGEYYVDLFRFQKTGSGSWEEIEGNDRFDKMINSKGGEGSGTFNRERTKFYYSYCGKDDGVCEIYRSVLSGGKWSEPTPLNHNINEVGYSSKHPSLTAGGDTLFFASNKDGFGQFDIWMSIDAGNDNWGPPMNLGDEINTPFNEYSPMYFPEKNALVFASDGHRGFGGYDIYIARGVDLQSAEIYNAGTPFNSYKDDIFFFLGNAKGFMSSNRDWDESVGNMDVYEFTVNSKEELLADVSTERTIAGRNALFEDDYNFDNSETEIINQIISRKLSSAISEIDPILTKRQLAVYNSLGSDDLQRIDRIVSSRVKKMTDNMMESIRTEDDYYYRQLTADKKKQVDNIVTAYLEQQGLGNSITLSKDMFQFYNNIDADEREQIDVVVSERVRIAENYVPASPTYNSFNDKEKLSLDGIAMKLLRQKKNLGNIRISVTEQAFLNKQAGSGKQADVFQALRERWITLSTEEGNKVGQAERDLFDSLSDSDQESLRSLASAYMNSDANTLGESIDNKDLELFKGKNLREQDKLNKLILRQISSLANADAYLAETSFTEGELQSAISEDAEETLQNLLSIRPDLNRRQQRALQRFVNSSFESYMAEPDEIFFDGPVVNTGLDGGNLAARMSDADLNQYNALSDRKKTLIDNLIGLDYLTDIRYSRGKKLRDEAELTRVPKAERVHIAVLSKNATGQKLKEFEKPFLEKAIAYYNNLSEGRKGFYNRVVLDDAFDMRNGSYVLADNDEREKRRLTAGELELMDRIKKFRFDNESILTENLMVATKDIDEVPFDIIAIAAEVEEENKAEQIISTEDILATEESGELRISLPIDKIEGYSEIRITGQLVNDRTDEPLTSFPITLVAFDDDATVVEGYTNPDGFFDFTVNPRKYDIRFRTTADNQGVNLAAFNVEGKRKKDSDIVVNSTRAFFDVNSFELRPEARILLDEIANVYGGSGNKIEIESHTDATGTVEYNLKLSKDRGYAARDYLMSIGVNASDISVIWHGAGKPIANNDDPFGRQLNRRLDLRLIGKNKRNFGSFYLVRPGATLTKIANSFGVTTRSIRNLNGLGAEVTAYQPIRVKSGKTVVNYDILVPADVQANENFIYTVMSNDDLRKVARKFNVPEELLMEQNNLTSPELKPGTKLIIYPKD